MPTVVRLDKSPNTIIVGENGAGKSTMIDAITFGLFGKPFRKVSKTQLISSVNEKDMLVEIKFSIGSTKYKVRRGMKPAKFEIYKNDKMLNQTASAKDYQGILEKNILKLTYKTFTQIVVLGNTSFVPFMQLTAVNRREVIEDLLDIQVFSVMNILLKERVSTNKDDIRDTEYQLDLAGDKSEIQAQYIQKIKDDKKKKIGSINKDIKATGLEIAKHNTEILELEGIIERLSRFVIDKDSVDSKKAKYLNYEDTITKKITRLKKDLKFFRDTDDCPVCTQHISEDLKVSKIESDELSITENEAGLEKLDIEINKFSERQQEISDTLMEINDIQSEIGIHNGHISGFNQYISKLNADVQTMNDTKDDLRKQKKELTALKRKVSELTKRQEELITLRNIHDMALTLLKDTGIKASIIKQYIPIINKLIAKYLAKFDFFVGFELDENFNESIKSRHRDEFSYASFSEGEKQRIDLSLLLTWRSIAKMKNSVNTNLLILDEIFDSSLDNTGCDEFMALIDGFGKETNIFVISHKGDVLIDKFLSTIKFEKYKGFSRITE